VALLSKISSTLNAVHVDIGHIIPASANTVLFELLVVGVIRDLSSCTVYHVSSFHIWFLCVVAEAGLFLVGPSLVGIRPNVLVPFFMASPLHLYI
jgi:hypothetical protein